MRIVVTMMQHSIKQVIIPHYISMPVVILLVLVLIGNCSSSCANFVFKSENFRLYHHYQDLSRRDGYLEFYRQTRNLRRTPLFIISLGNYISNEIIPSYLSFAGNAILVAIVEVLEYHPNLWKDPLKPYHFLFILTGIEVLIVLIALLRYLGKIIRTIEWSTCLFPSRSIDDKIQQETCSSRCYSGRFSFEFRHTRNNSEWNRFSVCSFDRKFLTSLSRLVMKHTKKMFSKNKPI